FISLVLRNFQDIQIVKYAFFGIRAGVLALVIRAFYTMWKKAPHSLFAYGVMLAAFLAVAFFKVNAIYVIIACGLFGLIYSLIALKLEKKEDAS
ncbi:MAG: chromate transporter, partial [Lachnospiraceae bacterium]|nr:chromate transporter [Lachnospiraceae bacterium]